MNPRRELFDVPRHIAYLNCASTAPLLNAARDAVIEATRSRSHPWSRSPADFLDDAEKLRGLCSEVIGGEAGGYAIVPSASYGLAVAAQNLSAVLGPGHEILIIAAEFPSLVLTFRRLAAERRASLVVAPEPGDGDWTRAIVERIGARTRIVAVSTCHWTDGRRIDIERVSRACRDAGAALVVDATQTIGAFPFDFQSVQPDFLAAAGYKWMLAPYGVSYLHVAPKWRDGRPLEETWLGRENATDLARLVNPSDRYQPGARRFDAGEKGTPLLRGAIASLEQIRDWSVAGISRALAEITGEIAGLLHARGFEVPPEAARVPHIVGVKPTRRDAAGIVRLLRERDVYVGHRGDSLRFAPHLHVDPEDLGRLESALDTIAA